MLNLNVIQVTNLDKAKVDEIVQTINQLTQNSDKQELKLKLNNVTGNTESAMEIVNAAHSQDIVDLVIEVSGKNNAAGTILTAAGLPGKRSANPGVSFCLNDEEPYPEDSKIADFGQHDKSVYETVRALTGKGKQIFNEIKNATTFGSEHAKKYNILDTVPKFVSKYRNKDRNFSDNETVGEAKSSDNYNQNTGDNKNNTTIRKIRRRK